MTPDTQTESREPNAPNINELIKRFCTENTLAASFEELTYLLEVFAYTKRKTGKAVNTYICEGEILTIPNCETIRPALVEKVVDILGLCK